MGVSTDISTLKKGKKCTNIVRNISEKKNSQDICFPLGQPGEHWRNWVSCQVSVLIYLQSTGWMPLPSYSTRCWQRFHIPCH